MQILGNIVQIKEILCRMRTVPKTYKTISFRLQGDVYPTVASTSTVSSPENHAIFNLVRT